MSDADAHDVIEKALRDRHMADQNDPILKGGDALRLNAHLYAFAVLDALADAGYAVVRKGAPDYRYEQGYTDGGNSKLADVLLFFDEVFEVEPMGYDLNARIVKELEERF